MKHRITQYIIIIAIISAISGAYFYFQSNAAQKINSSKVNNLTSGLVGYWTMDGNNISGTSLTDSSGNGNAGTINGAVPAIGKIGQALNFDSTTDYVSINDPGTSTLDITGDETISAWVKLDSLPSNKRANIIRKTNSFYFMLDNNWNCGGSSGSDGTYELIIQDGTDACSNLNVINTANRWYYVVVTRTSGLYKFYVDGSQAGSVSSGFAPSQNDNVTYIGNLGTSSMSNFPGTLDEVRIYSRALSASEITELYQQGQTKVNASQAGKLTSGLINYWSMDGGNVNWSDTSSEVKDQAGSNNCDAGGNITSAYARPGKIGQGLYFDGSGDSLNCGDISLMDGAQELTVSLWINPAVATQDDLIFVKNLGSTSLSISADGGNPLLLRLDAEGDDTSLASTDPAFLAVNNWYHLVMVFDGTQSTNADKLKLYKNASSSTLTFPGDNIPATTQISNASNFTIGATGGVSPKAIIDEVRVYDRALSPSEITELYQQGQAKINASQTGKLTSGLVGYWTMDGQDISGTTLLDKSGYSTPSNGTISGATAAIGKIGQALDFNGSTQKVTVPSENPSGPYITTNRLTVSAWFKADTLYGGSSYNPIVSKVDAIDNWYRGYMLYFDADIQKLVFFVNTYNPNDAYSHMATKAFTNDNNWHHAVGIYDGSNMQLYIDNVAGTAAAYSGAINMNSTTYLGIGFANTNHYFDGKIDEVRVYNRALSQSEITELYNMGR